MEVTAEDWKDADEAEAFAQAANGGRADIRNLRLAQVELDLNEATFFSEPVGTIVGPTPRMVNSNRPSVRAHHGSRRSRQVPSHSALCQKREGPGGNAALGARADSLKRVLRNGGDFDDLVQRFSEDPGSKALVVCTTSSPRAGWWRLSRTSALTSQSAQSDGSRPLTACTY